jgi:hypothetical protein
MAQRDGETEIAQPTRLERNLRWLKDHRLFSVILLVGSVIIAIGSFTDAITKFRSLVTPQRDSSTDGKEIQLTVDAKELFLVVQEYLDERNRLFGLEPTTPESVLSYIDSVAREADALANVWDDIANDFESGSRTLTSKYRFSSAANEPYFSRLSEFYELLPEAVGDRLDETWMRRLAQSAEVIIMAREDAQETLKQLSSQLGDPAFLERANTREGLQTLRASVIVLQREAAALEALSKAVRASVGSRRPSAWNSRPARVP